MTECTDRLSPPTFILASQSPRRKQLLEDAGYRFEVIVPPIDEPAAEQIGLSPAQQAESLAYFKAAAVMEQHHPPLPVVAADTVVALGEQVFGKPRDADDARRILSTLSGTRHQVITGMAVLDPSGHRLIASDVTHVRMRQMAAAELDRYIDSGLWEGKAGAYGIQDRDDPVVECIEGSFSNVVGMPMDLLKGLFAQLLLRHCR